MIVLVRHGETAGNLNRVMQVPEIPLSATGLAQAERLAERLCAQPIARVLCSDLTRARMTVAPFLARTRIPVEYSPLLAERNFGALRGTPYADLGFDPFEPGYAPPGGESWEVFHARVARAFAWIVEQRAQLGGSLLVVTHALVCRALIARHAGLAPDVVLPERFANTSVSILDPEPPHALSLLNCSAHL